MTTLFAFGCPHSGTTYLWRSLQAVAEIANERTTCASCRTQVYRITESNPLHPCLSPNGLISLAMMAVGANGPIVLVRIIRDPVDIFESFYAKRQPGHGAYMKGVNDDERIFDFIEQERTNVRRQKERYAEFKKAWTEKGKRGWPFHLIEVKYEELDDERKRIEFCAELGAHAKGVGEILHTYLADTWKKKPIRHGRLKMGITKTLLPKGLKAEIVTRCSSQ